jgi:hypothetical protein
MTIKGHLAGGVALAAIITLGAAPAFAAEAKADAKAPAKAAAKHHAKHHAKKAVVKAPVESKDHAELEALRGELAALRGELAEVRGAQAKTAADNAALAQAVSHDSVVIKSLPGELKAEVKTEVAKVAPKTDKIYYKGVTVTLGGFLAAETMWRQRSELSDIPSRFDKIPLANNPQYNIGETRFSARQSRVSALIEGNADKNTHLAFYNEIDFLGAAQTANSNESNSYNPRIRHMYATVDWNNFFDGGSLHLLAGQAWSLVTLNSKGITPRNEVTPPQIDAQYIPGFMWARQPQIRVTGDFLNKSLWVAVSAENGQTGTLTGGTSNTLATGTGANSAFFNATNYSYNQLPDFVAKVAYETKILEVPTHLEVFGLLRDFNGRQFINPTTGGAGSSSSVPSATNAPSNKDVYGGSFGGSVIANLVPGVLDAQASFMAGRGIGRYGSSQLADATTDSVGNLKPLMEVSFLAGATWHYDKTLDLYLFGGEESLKRQAYLVGGAFAAGYGNPLVNLSQCAIENGSCAGVNHYVDQITGGFWHKPYVGSFGRVQWGVQYSYTQRALFSGNPASAPNTYKASDSMVFTSIRYYPF